MHFWFRLGQISTPTFYSRGTRHVSSHLLLSTGTLTQYKTLVSSVRKLLEKVGDFILLIYTKPGQIVSDFHPRILNWVHICFFLKLENSFGCICSWFQKAIIQINLMEKVQKDRLYLFAKSFHFPFQNLILPWPYISNK